MEDKITLGEYIRQLCQSEAEQNCKKLYKTTALFGAASCLAETNLKDSVEQVKYLHERFIKSDLKLQLIPWVWLEHCIKEKLITQLPNEDWVNSVFIGGAYFEGGPPLVLKFLQKNIMA